MQNQPGKTYIVTERDFNDAVYDVAHVKYIRDNSAYEPATKEIFAFMEDGDDTINACAFHIPDVVKQLLGEQMAEYNYGILMYAGMLRWLSVLGHVGECLARTANVSKARKMLSWMRENAIEGDAGSDFVKRFCHEFHEDTEGARLEQTMVYAIAALRSVVAHEMGHICLGHVNNVNCEQMSLSRNDERSADLFASSVAQSMLNGMASVIGTVLVDISFTWLKDTKKLRMFGSHPDPTERVSNFIDSFNAMLVGTPITTKMLKKLCR